MKGTSHKKQLTRVNRIEGQVRGIRTMIEEEKYCVDIMTQIKAVRSALKSLELEILDNHAHHCLMNAVTSGKESTAREKVDEILDLIKKSTKG
jgi:DNA-binding FrmR family transcriptional regulator